MNNYNLVLLSGALSMAISWSIVSFREAPVANSSASVAAKESVYERVVNSHTLRCGYFEEPPFTIIDPNSGKKSGITVELAEKIASELGLDIEWTAETNFSTLTDDLKNNKYDAVCGSLFTLPRGGKVDYTMPYSYVPVYAYTQAGRTEFDNKLEQLDWSKISIAGLDGEGATMAALKKLPDAKFILLPQNMQISDMLTSVVNKKADITFVMPAVFQQFDRNNHGKLAKVASDKPFYMFTVAFAFKTDESAFKNMLDFTVRNLIAEGYVDDLFKKYDPDGLLFRPAALYKMAQ